MLTISGHTSRTVLWKSYGSTLLKWFQSMSESTHLERTQGVARDEIVSEAVVSDVKVVSPTTKSFVLKVTNPLLSFRPGQWVDLRIPKLDIVGGYSITSTPTLLKTLGTISLAIKHSCHPPTLWMCTQCEASDRLSIQVGGNFYYYPTMADEERDLLLVAGGMGVNPLFSILQHQASFHLQRKTCLMLCAKSTSELLFKDEIDQICQTSTNIQSRYFVTKDPTTHANISNGRIGKEDLLCALGSLDPSKLACYVCGPPPMTKHILQCLEDLGVQQQHIHYEKWW